MKHISIAHDGCIVNWQLDPRPDLKPGRVLLLVAADVTADSRLIRGLPRVDYARAYNVVPQEASEARAVEIFREGWRRGHETTGGSNDDAGIGDLSVRVARLYDVPITRRVSLEAWYAVNYPGVGVVFA